MSRHESSFVLGIDGGTEGVRAGLYSTVDGREVAFCAASYPTSFPQPGWAEQAPEDWWRATGEAVRGCLSAAAAASVPASAVRALCCDTTCCTVVSLDAADSPVRPALLWMDMRSEQCAAEVAATGDAALLINGGGGGGVSAEWMLPKALWLSRQQDSWSRTARLCEFQDFLNLRLTGQYVASGCNAAVRWHWAGGSAPPTSLLAKLGLSSLLQKWPATALAPGELIPGGLTAEAAAHLGLPAGLPVAQGGADAFVGMLGLGVMDPGQVALLTGSSHLHLAVAPAPLHGPGVWGSYAGALPARAGGAPRHVLEGGQTSTGSAVSWFRRHLAPDCSFADLDAEAAGVRAGCEGLLCQEHWQGNRTPHTDAGSRGVWAGLSLSHTRAHMYRSLLEGVAFGTRLTLQAMAARGAAPRELVVAGGAARSPLWLQIHADVTGLPLRITRCGDAPALGCALLAALAVGAHVRGICKAVETKRSRHLAGGSGGGGGGDGAALADGAARPRGARGVCAVLRGVLPVIRGHQGCCAGRGGGGGGGGRRLALRQESFAGWLAGWRVVGMNGCMTSLLHSPGDKKIMTRGG